MKKKDIVIEAMEENGLTKEDLIKIMSLILAHPRKHKHFYIYEISSRVSRDKAISKLITKLVEIGFVRQEKDMNKYRLTLTPSGLRYLMRLRGYDD